MKIRKHKLTSPNRQKHRKVVLPALVAVGGSLAGAQATAFELGNIVVHSTIGQPLHASIVYALGPNETLEDNCVSVRSKNFGASHAAASRPTARVADGKITITGRNAVMEPMVVANVAINCPYTPNVSREYLLMLDPAGTQPVKMETTTNGAADPAAPAPVATTPIARRQPVADTPIAVASQYRVLPGDSLSAIASRLEGRSVDVQTAMNAIYDANIEAFIDANPDLLQAGSLLDIPALAGDTVSATANAVEDAWSSVPASTTEFDTTEFDTTEYDTGGLDNVDSGSVYQGAESLTTDVPEEPAAESVEPVEDFVDFAPEAVTEPVSAEVADPVPAEDYGAEYSDLVPGDAVVESAPAEDVANEATVAPVPAPRPAQQIISSQEPERTSSWDWLIWIAAGAISIFAGVLLIGPRLRERFGSKPVGGPAAESRPISEHAAPSTPSITAPEPAMAVEEIKPTYNDVDFDLSDDSPTEENLALDADLVAGTGLESNEDVQVNQDFGFAATAELDLELTEQAARQDESPGTDIIPPPERTSVDMVVDAEVLPDDSQYDMSVLLDATKMPHPDDVTERDLKAVPLDDTGQTPIADAYTINNEVDFDKLEQDYEDEFTATQALNQEIEQAAAELADRMDDVPVGDDDTSVEMQLTNMSELDLTANLEAQNDDLGDDDVTAKMETEDETVEMPKGKGGAKAG